MRVLMVSPCYYPVKGGTETTVRNLAIALNKNKIQTDVMAFNVDQTRKPRWQGKTERIDGIVIYRIPALDWLPITHSARVTAGVNFIPGKFTHILKKYDVIHFHEVEFSFPFFSFFVKKPKIIHLHGIDYNFLKRHHISRFLLKHLVKVYISISKRMKKELINLGVPENRIIYLPNSIDVNHFKPKRRKQENMLLFVGRIAASKGLHILIRSLQHLKDNVCLVIIGPPDWDANYHKNILRMIEKENRKRKHEVRYLGTLEPTKLAEWYQKASLFILPSFAEGFPVTILEALACETPVIATPVGGIPEIIRNGETGILIRQNTPAYVAKAIQYLLENRDVRLRMGRKGREYVVRKHSLENVCKKLHAIYKQLIN
ncbi:glycosyltransferase family 4 protein [Candidatus Bathyarchaeota archaeon]|nr:glycosyltransferase family 4 protein [Candidatus Bathyarchaeota archaeon]